MLTTGPFASHKHTPHSNLNEAGRIEGEGGREREMEGEGERRLIRCNSVNELGSPLETTTTNSCPVNAAHDPHFTRMRLHFRRTYGGF